MSRKLNETFRHLINIGEGKKTIVYECDCCGAVMTAMRRDLTYVLITFMEAVRDMSGGNREAYFAYREVIAYAQKHYACTPSDYSILERWKLIETRPGVNMGKYKRISAAGYRFLADELMVAAFHYQIPHSESVMYSKEKTNYSSLKFAWLEKQDKKPFFDPKNQSV